MRATKIIGLFLLLTAVLAVRPAVAQDRRLELHVANRLAFGPDPETLADIRRLGVDGWIKRQLDPGAIAEPAALAERLDRLDTLKLDVVALFTTYGPPAQPGATPEGVKTARQRANVIVLEARTARLLRAIESPRQLQEVLVDFWFNHFNVFASKGLDYLWIGDYENRAIRPHVLGRFRDLLAATARHPAMLFYLDNRQNTAPGSPGAKGPFTGLNENYARELMELHTLGVNGGYTQDDVIALARVLTGWGIASPLARQPSDNGFAFDASRHDFGDKVLLGQTIKGEGAPEVERALDILAASPATARHLSFELAQYFVADQPPPALVERLAREWQQDGGDIRAVLRVLFASPEFRAPENFGGKFKTPYQYVVSAVRAAGVPVADVQPLLSAMTGLGQPLYGCLTPDGYKNTRQAWLNPDALTLRIAFATQLGAGRLPLEGPRSSQDQAAPAMAQPAGAAAPATSREAAPAKPVDAARVASLVAVSPRTQAAVEAAPAALKAALLLGGPDFMSR